MHSGAGCVQRERRQQGCTAAVRRPLVAQKARRQLPMTRKCMCARSQGTRDGLAPANAHASALYGLCARTVCRVRELTGMQRPHVQSLGLGHASNTRTRCSEGCDGHCSAALACESVNPTLQRATRCTCSGFALPKPASTRDPRGATTQVRRLTRWHATAHSRSARAHVPTCPRARRPVTATHVRMHASPAPDQAHVKTVDAHVRSLASNSHGTARAR